MADLLCRQREAMKIRKAYIPVLFFGVILLFLLNCYLYRQNNIYKVQNRELILQNDSLIAVTIELKRGMPIQSNSVFNRDKSKLLK